MLVAMVTITPGAAIGARRQLRALLLPGQRRVHTAKESPRRRRELLDVVARLDITAVAFSTRRPAGHHRAEIRDRLLNAAAVHAQTVGAMSWILDHQDPAQAQRDRLNITATLGRNAQLVYDHRSSRGRTAALGSRRDRVGNRSRRTVGSSRRSRDHRATTWPLTRNTRLLTVRRARRVHFLPR